MQATGNWSPVRLFLTHRKSLMIGVIKSESGGLVAGVVLAFSVGNMILVVRRGIHDSPVFVHRRQLHDGYRSHVGACQVIRNHRDTSNSYYGPQPFCSPADTKCMISIRVKLKLVQKVTGARPEVSQYSI